MSISILVRGAVVLLVDAAVLLLLSALLNDFTLDGPGAALGTAALVGVLNALVWPLLARFALPLNVMTLGLGALIFLGGWQFPFGTAAFWGDFAFIYQAILVFAKSFLIILTVMWISATFPRLRIDQLMAFCWKILMEVAFLQIIITGIVLVYLDGAAIARMPHQDLLDFGRLAELLGYDRKVNTLDYPVSPRGYRILGRIPRLPKLVVQNIVREFRGLDEILAATDPELESVEGVGEIRAKDIREGLRRLQEINLVDRYLQT
jgi:uncharacterized membrane protein YvlD (DUF360 family)